MAASARNNMFIACDRDFRKLRAHNNMPWDVIHQESYLALSYRNQNVSHNPHHTQGNNPFRGGSVTLSRRQGVADVTTVHTCSHACSKCGGNHHPRQLRPWSTCRCLGFDIRRYYQDSCDHGLPVVVWGSSSSDITKTSTTMIHLSLFEGSSSGDITKTDHGTLVIV